MDTIFVEVYRFPNGFAGEASSMYGWLRHANLNPTFSGARSGDSDGDTVIRLPADEVACLRQMQGHDPARWGNAPKFENGSSVRILSDTHGVRHRGRVGKVVRKACTAGYYHVQMSYRIGPLVVHEDELEDWTPEEIASVMAALQRPPSTKVVVRVPIRPRLCPTRRRDDVVLSDSQRDPEDTGRGNHEGNPDVPA